MREQAPLSVNTKDAELNEWSTSPCTFVGNYQPLASSSFVYISLSPGVSSACCQMLTWSLVRHELHVLHANLTMPCCVSFQGGLLLKLWQKAMSTEEGRKKGRELIESVTSSHEFDLEGI